MHAVLVGCSFPTKIRVVALARVSEYVGPNLCSRTKYGQGGPGFLTLCFASYVRCFFELHDNQSGQSMFCLSVESVVSKSKVLPGPFFFFCHPPTTKLPYLPVTHWVLQRILSDLGTNWAIEGLEKRRWSPVEIKSSSKWENTWHRFRISWHSRIHNVMSSFLRTLEAYGMW